MEKIPSRVALSFLAAAAIVVGVSAPAHAADPTIDGAGIITIGDAHWQMDQYGLAYGWDAADVYDLDGYLYYPAEFYSDDYLYCGPSGPPVDGTVTVEANGDLTVACPAGPWGSTGLVATLTIRFYAESASGYLARQFVTISNPTGAEVVVDPAGFDSYYYDGYTGTQGTPGFGTSSSSNTLQPTDTWYVSVDPTGASVVETQAWARTGSTSGHTADSASFLVTYSAADSTFAPGETKYFVNFTNMVIPTAQTPEAAAVALDISLEQTSEFASFSGRLLTGLPEGITAIGWGSTPVTPALANTGSEVSARIVLFGSTAGILALAGGLLVARSRSRSHA